MTLTLDNENYLENNYKNIYNYMFSNNNYFYYHVHSTNVKGLTKEEVKEINLKNNKYRDILYGKLAIQFQVSANEKESNAVAHLNVGYIFKSLDFIELMLKKHAK